MAFNHCIPAPAALHIAPDKPWLAPLAGFSDLPFRLLCREHGAAVACTEMVSAKGLVYGGKGSDDLLATCPADSPLVVQLFGCEREFVERAVERLLAAGFTHFDLNAGCSVAKVVKTGSGAALLKTPERLADVAEAMVRLAGPGRVGVKFRLGWSVEEENFLGVGRALEDVGVAWLTLHPRFARQGFGGVADWTAVGRLKERVGVPVLASGDLFTAEDGVACLKASGADGVMFARGAMSDPAIFSRFLGLLAGEAAPPPDGRVLAAIMRRHVEFILERHNGHGDDFGRARALLKMRTVIARYVRSLEGSRALRKAMSSCTSWERLNEIIETAKGLPAVSDRRAALAGLEDMNA